MLNWLKSLFARTPPHPGLSPPIPHPDPIGAVRWMDSGDPENPFGVRIINCFSTAMGLLSLSESLEMTQSYGRLRSDDGRRHIGTFPNNPLIAECELRYAIAEPIKDGRVHTSLAMEDKWDGFLYEGRLYFARSWSGQLVHAADVPFTSSAVLSQRSLQWVSRP
jgi:hypothetical protein